MRADDLAHGRFGLVSRGDEAVGVGRKADAVREDGEGEIVDVVGDAVVAAAQKRPRPRQRGRAPSRRAGRPPGAAGTFAWRR